MATENILKIVSRIAGTNVTNKRFVKEAAGGVVDRTTANTDVVAGVVAMVSTGTTGTTIAAGDEVPMAIPGSNVIVESGDAVADRARVMSDASGRAITFAAGAGALAVGEVVGGSSASAAGQDLSVKLYAQPQAIA
jgi:hypothetical protein